MFNHLINKKKKDGLNKMESLKKLLIFKNLKNILKKK